MLFRSSKPNAGDLLGGWVNTARSTAQSIFTGLMKPKETDLKSKEPKNKTVYVRKSFKDGVTETVTTVGTAVGQAIDDDDAFDFGETSVPDAKDLEVAEVVETKVVEVLDEFGDAIDEVKDNQ